MSYNRTDPKALLLSFPSIRGTLDPYPTDESTFATPEAMQEWAASSHIGESNQHVVDLVAAVIAGSPNYGEFDLFAAMSKWDSPNKTAFKAWLEATWI